MGKMDGVDTEESVEILGKKRPENCQKTEIAGLMEVEEATVEKEVTSRIQKEGGERRR